ncbi:MAG: DNA polymerase III subunit epsilon [Firmicutes bacterium HGW-Firmicutes-14]|nr:MAG: DNA polymerase III subunit epsilon [Firmicutes bacterium HGW-Firmicutes-14]
MRDLFRILQWAVGLRSPREEIHSGEIDPAVLLEIRYKTMAEKNKVPADIPLCKARFVVFDLETTGLYPYGGDEITSVSAVVVDNGRLKRDTYFDYLVNPKRPIPPIATEITGITDEMVSDAPSVLWVLNEFLDFARNSILVAHCIDFDFHFINLKLKQFCHTKIHHPTVDTNILANAFLTGKGCINLDELLRFFRIEPEGRHTSLGDSLMTAQVLIDFLQILAERGIHTLSDLNYYLHWRAFQ